MLHQIQSPSTPFSLVEFQGGSFDPWGGPGFESCAAFLNHEFERVFYKNNFAAGARIFNVYMIYGGTNWGGLGYPGGYFSYDYGAVRGSGLVICMIPTDRARQSPRTVELSAGRSIPS